MFKGRCARSSMHAICGGHSRSCAWRLTGDVWAEDPGCYLTAGGTRDERELLLINISYIVCSVLVCGRKEQALQDGR